MEEHGLPQQASLPLVSVIPVVTHELPVADHVNVVPPLCLEWCRQVTVKVCQVHSIRASLGSFLPRTCGNGLKGFGRIQCIRGYLACAVFNNVDTQYLKIRFHI